MYYILTTIRDEHPESNRNAMAEGLSIDLGSAIPYLEQRILKLFGKDAVSAEWRQKLKTLISISYEQAAHVQCVGMPRPIPLPEIYQPTTLVSPLRQRVKVGDLIDSAADAIVLGGPGWGKSTLFHWIYFSQHKSTRYLPILFTLRWPGALADLVDFVTFVSQGKRLNASKEQLLLLVDGYDEVPAEARKLVSRTLLAFRSLKRGAFWLSCRSFYNIYDLPADQYEIAPFTSEDSLAFAQTFLRIYGVKIAPQEQLRELETHGFKDFVAHPLMLALVCILKTGANPEIPRKAIGLIRRAIDTLAFRWDEAKGINRESTIPLDAEERVRCMMRVAYDIPLQADSVVVERSVQEHLKLLQLKSISSTKLLEEMAQWFGLLIPVGVSHWQFAHKTVHDYLAARYWIENGKFAPNEVREWNTRAAYACCLLADATSALCQMLRWADSLEAFTESLYNQPLFDTQIVASALIERLAQHHDREKRTWDYKETATEIVCNWKESECLLVASDDFLRDCYDKGSRERMGEPAWVKRFYVRADMTQKP